MYANSSRVTWLSPRSSPRQRAFSRIVENVFELSTDRMDVPVCISGSLAITDSIEACKYQKGVENMRDSLNDSQS